MIIYRCDICKKDIDNPQEEGGKLAIREKQTMLLKTGQTMPQVQENLYMFCKPCTSELKSEINRMAVEKKDYKTKDVKK